MVTIKTALPEPRMVKGKPLDPSAQGNWKNVEPDTEEQMNQWLQDEERLLLAHLTYYQNLIDDSAARQQVVDAQTKVDEEWKKWEPEYDMTTGEIYDEAIRNRMDEAMATASNDLKQVDHANNRKIHDIYTAAQVMWNGDRSKLKGPIGPSQLHMFPDNLRHSSKHPNRRDHLAEKFPMSDLRLDDDAIAKKHAEVEQRRKEKGKADRSTVDKSKHATRITLPEDHQLYHATTESSQPWQYKGRRVHTSWESADWGPAVASKQRVLGTKRKSDRPCFRTHLVEHVVDGWDTAYGPNLERTRDNVNGGWVLARTGTMISRRIFELDEDDQRIPIDHFEYDRPTYTPSGTVTAVHARDGTFTARREAYPKTSLVKFGDDELSDASDGEYHEDDVPLPDPSGGDPSGGESSGGDSSDEGGDDETDDDGDLFRMSYLGLINETPRPAPPGSDGGDSPSHGGDSPHHGGDSPSHGGDSPSHGGGNDPSGGDGSDPKGGSDTENGNDDPPRPNGHEQRVKGESFEYGEDEQGKFCFVTMRHKGPKGIMFTQRDRIPVPNPDAPEDLDERGKPYTVVYPRKYEDDSLVPAPRDKESKSTEWTRGENGVYQRHDRVWRPNFVQRAFRRDTGEYVKYIDSRSHFDKVISSNFGSKAVTEFNKKVNKFSTKNDADTQAKTPKQPGWRKEELEALARYLSDVVHQKGLKHVTDNWTTVVKDVAKPFQKFQTETLKTEARSDESIRRRIARGSGIKRKNEAAENRIGTMSKAQQHPANYFTADDFKEVKEAKGGATSKKRKQDDVSKTAPQTGGSDDETGSEGDESEAPKKKKPKKH
ncbi:hypothetical protein C7974DRAFT_471257 [Boeremia exigua]|uniref:uncharacterized protein n=1 Tax=Boeremia exigua TaxID=749465 RepID=UPI001E8E52FF|nr:uncharacterized protein C7974DRAFT_471257 [Boeremia exigua]KAH6632992.1 hypothetical protein C7974DRAFT_471257 [Boeremia exigua]